ncbi:hypothetical protein EXA18_06495 [Vibrio cincinnatiensis]|uniref:hypothetical protein n=1 Tax=Vibrio cincinnatiensis TaxID=675 RepID=UPI001EDF0166|nr:hypothetical protein [Vibrio cincinnatiensis]MCG3743138.1 hypothetical protein [Vibrio cincinnatiensis]
MHSDQEHTKNIKVLINFQRYRTGEDSRTFEETGLKPKQITHAIDWAIETLSKSHPNKKEMDEQKHGDRT